MRASKSAEAEALAFEFMVLAAARGGRVRGAVWREMDEDSVAWTIPASRMKMERQHRVPPSGRALEILEADRKPGNGKSPVASNGRAGISSRS